MSLVSLLFSIKSKPAAPVVTTDTAGCFYGVLLD
jgi:hypothetical protein